MEDGLAHDWFVNIGKHQKLRCLPVSHNTIDAQKKSFNIFNNYALAAAVAKGKTER